MELVVRHVRRAAECARARGRRRARSTARHGRGVRALPVRALPHGGRVQRGAAGAPQPAAARAAAGPLLGVTAAGAPECGSRESPEASLRPAGGARAGGEICASAAGAGAASAPGVLRVGVPAASTLVAQVLRAGVPGGHRGISASVALRGVRGGRGRSSPGLHATASSSSGAAAPLRTSGAAVLCAGSKTAATST